ncbi:hypothetical protein ERO13_A13G162300v2 [Gossypium hirsutum]|uniref:Uncharacterized protein n=1 Tax=Gossypium tomentosum TaxID=34277 RepID=A0A5D2MMN4_GOSTO|nr:hypothetical protein ERO13_A13G162300v2 [Gossypium hirsutum]TYH92705.1 hypothetical protein ES332_A13G201200v1 [Gossypium tomentosum]
MREMGLLAPFQGAFGRPDLHNPKTRGKEASSSPLASLSTTERGGGSDDVATEGRSGVTKAMGRGHSGARLSLGRWRC